MNYALVRLRWGLRSVRVSLLAALDIVGHFRLMSHGVNPYLAVSGCYTFMIPPVGGK